ncbi:DNA/RNA-binding protein AlbA [archaeon]|nr:DNA/RNA-binding protein AlbA [archaeon]
MAEEERTIIFVGRRPLPAYMLAIVLAIQRGTKRFTVKARGTNIPRAVDVVEAVKRRFPGQINVTDIRIGSEEFTTEEGRKRFVSSIEIEFEVA